MAGPEIEQSGAYSLSAQWTNRGHRGNAHRRRCRRVCATGIALLLLSACDPIARDSDVQPAKDMAEQAYMNTLRLADENAALRDRVKELEAERAETADWIAKLTARDVEQARNIESFIKHYNEHLEKNH